MARPTLLIDITKENFPNYWNALQPVVDRAGEDAVNFVQSNGFPVEVIHIVHLSLIYDAIQKLSLLHQSMTPDIKATGRVTHLTDMGNGIMQATPVKGSDEESANAHNN